MFADRTDAGRRLARHVEHLRGGNVVVLGLPRGGVPVAAEVAAALDAPLDVLVVRKLGVPFQKELAMGAIGEDGARVLNSDVVRGTGDTDADIAATESAERAEAERRSRRFRGDRPPVALAGKTAVIVDDGIATGATARAACQIARVRGATRIVLAVPIAPPEAESSFADVADELIVVEYPRLLSSIGQWYRDFRQTPDDEVVALLSTADRETSTTEVLVDADGVTLPGILAAPRRPLGVVVFAHGSGSSRLSPRNQQVATAMRDSGLATFLFDLLTPGEAEDRANVFDIELLAGRVVSGVRVVTAHPDTKDLPVGLFGASTGAAAALWAAAEPAVPVQAVVSRGGRPDLAAERLPLVTAPTLLIVGSLDTQVLDLNRGVLSELVDSGLAVVDGAGHLFEEPGALAEVAELAAAWFTRKLNAVA